MIGRVRTVAAGRRMPAKRGLGAKRGPWSRIGGLAIAVLFAVPLDAAAHPEVAACEALSPMTEVKRCYNEAAEEIDRRVERAFRRAIAAAADIDTITGHGDAVPALAESQALWRASRRADCVDLQAALAAGGSGTGVFMARCAIDRARARIVELDAIAAKASGVGRAPPPASLSCRGNEPFWDLVVDAETAALGRLDGAAGRVVSTLSGTLASLDFLVPQLFVWRGRGETAGGDLIAMISREHCVDTMSDEGPSGGVFDYRARISLPAGEVVVGCCSAGAVPVSARTPSEEPMDLTGTAWIAEDIDGRGVIDTLQSTLRFEAEGRVSGTGGCNRYFGPVTIDGGALAFGPLAGTKMACPPAIMDQEQRFLAALAKVTRFETRNGLLYLFGDGSAPLLRFSRRREG